MDNLSKNCEGLEMSSEKRKYSLDEIFEKTKEIIDEIGYGSVTLVIQDGVVVQIERQEKIRIKNS